MGDLRYRTGELIKKGDRVRIGTSATVVDLVMTRDSSEWEECWNAFGEGVLLQAEHPSGLYVRLDEPALVFLGRPESGQ